jgi:uncharacterized repeat protein (TIGR03803 family)
MIREPWFRLRLARTAGALAVLSAAQFYAPGLSQSKMKAPRHRHGLAQDVRVHADASATSSSWSGYVVSGTFGSVTDAKGSWIVPAVTCAGSGSSFSSFWVGIDGYLPTSSTVEQIGTESDCADGAPSYFAWYEFFPAIDVVIENFPIQAGDKMSAEVRYSSGLFILTITDETTGLSAPPVTGTAPSAARSSAEWIAEDPRSPDGVLQPLANFGTAAYGSDNTGAANTCAATIGAKTGGIGSFSGATKITMVNAGFSEAVPAPLSTDGSSFSVATQPLTTLQSFSGGNGYLGVALAQGPDGNLYGTTEEGGASGDGTVFKITTGGAPFTSLHSFSGSDGALPAAGLTLAANGDFYGTTFHAGPGGYGTVFRVTSHTLTTLLGFDGNDGANPNGSVIQGTDGKFYGTTYHGSNGNGSVFAMTSAGAPTTLHSFDVLDGSGPVAGLVQGTDGDFYGTTYAGGAHNEGTVFKITAGGVLSNLYNFAGGDGANPEAGLVQATDGNFYGTTDGGGVYGYGTVFRITSGGTLTTLYSFLNSDDGSTPQGGLVQATDGNLYGTTSVGGIGGAGTIFSITTRNPQLATLYSFSGPDGANLNEPLTQATDGNLYGATLQGGASGDGTVFRLNVGLGPFIKTITTSGKVGATVKILGTNLAGATSVGFNGTLAVFTVVSPSEISTAVPAGATTGKITVDTPSGTLLSNVPFRVKQ